MDHPLIARRHLAINCCCGRVDKPKLDSVQLPQHVLGSHAPVVPRGVSFVGLLGPTACCISSIFMTAITSALLMRFKFCVCALTVEQAHPF